MKFAGKALLMSMSIAIGIGGYAGAASAVTVPANDHIAHATVVSSLPFNQTLDTTRATTDSTDAAANATCGAPQTNNSVWYKFTGAHTNGVFIVDTTGSTFSSGVLIATGTPGKLTTVACAPVSVGISTQANTAYWVMVFDDTGNGGTLHLSMHGKGPVPANDTISHATGINKLPFSQTVDTTGATHDSNDDQANASCGAPSVGHSIWYKYTAGSNVNSVVFDASQANFASGVIVATGTAGNLTTVTCGPGSVVASVTPGTTYYVLVFDAAGGIGGTVNFIADLAPTLATTVKYQTLVDSSGTAHMQGTYTCTHGGTAPFLELSGQLVEIAGSNVVTGLYDSGPLLPTCDGAKHSWSADGIPDSAPFVAGSKAAALTFNLLCTTSTCITTNQNVVVSLVSSVSSSTATAPVTKSSSKATPKQPEWGTAGRANTAWGH
jgi:hypothetical protein